MPFVGIQLLMVAMIIAFPSMISVQSKTDMKEQIELNVQMPTDDGGSDMAINFNLDGDGDGKGGGKSDSTEIKLDMGDPDKK